jgi:hypothetical protein
MTKNRTLACLPPKHFAGVGHSGFYMSLKGTNI